jgi:hypothetical protein
MCFAFRHLQCAVQLCIMGRSSMMWASATLTSWLTDRAAVRDTAPMREENSLLILWINSCSKTRYKGASGAWGNSVIECSSSVS